MNLWNYIRNISTDFKLPWVVAGDFNSILSSSDRINSGVYNAVGDPNFMDFISYSSLIEADFTCNYFTWRGGINFSIHNKIDRVFVNSLRLDKFTQFGIDSVYHSLRDHTPISIKIIPDICKKSRLPFKFNNAWPLQEDYHSLLQEALQTFVPGNPLFLLMYKIKAAKATLKAWIKTNRIGSIR